MARLLVYYAHPGHRFSQVNSAMAAAAQEMAQESVQESVQKSAQESAQESTQEGALDAQSGSSVAFLDLYRAYPRHNIDVATEQARLLAHDVVLFQFPLFWYSTPSLIKEWIDLVLQNGFAYGAGGDKLTGKIMMLAVSAAGSADAYTPKGYQHYPAAHVSDAARADRAALSYALSRALCAVRLAAGAGARGRRATCDGVSPAARGDPRRRL